MSLKLHLFLNVMHYITIIKLIQLAITHYIALLSKA